MAGFNMYSGIAKRDTLFIHGNLASARWWTPVFMEWRQQGSVGSGRLVAMDLPGCGEQAPWPEGSDIELQSLAADVIRRMDQLDMGQVDLVGHSLGGLIGLQIMALAPERVNKCFLLSSVGAKGMVFDEGMFDVFHQMATNAEITRAVILSTIHKSDRLSAELKDQLSEDAFKAVHGMGPAVLRMLKKVDLSAYLALCRHPCLVVHGQEDLIIPKTDSEQLAKILPGAKLEILTDVGHCWNVEDPVAMTKRLRDWF